MEDDDEDLVDEDMTYNRVIIPNLDRIWLKLKPS